MSGEAMMQDSTKHIYHSIPLETDGPVVMTERSHCCTGGRKAMTLLLASALLWVIVLDIMLVVYKSHHLSSAGKEGPEIQLTEGVVVIPVLPSVDGGKNLSFSSTPPPRNSTNQRSRGPRQSAEGPRQNAEGPGQGPGRGERSTGVAKSGKSGAVTSGLQGWLSRLRHRPQPVVTSSDHSDRQLALPPVWGRSPPTGQRPWIAGGGHNNIGPFRRQFAPSAEFIPHKPSQPNHGLGSQGPGSQRLGNQLFGNHKLTSSKLQNHEFGNHELGNRGLTNHEPGSPKMNSDKEMTSSRESPFLIRFFSAIVDAPWNLTTTGDGRRRPPPPPPPPPPFVPGPFLSLLDRPRFSALLNDNDMDDAEETIFDIDISD